MTTLASAQPKIAQMQAENEYYVPNKWKELYGRPTEKRGSAPVQQKRPPEITGRPVLSKQLKSFDMEVTNQNEQYAKAVRQRALALHDERKNRIWEEYERLKNKYPVGSQQLAEGIQNMRRMLEKSEADATSGRYVWEHGSDKFNEVQASLHHVLGARHILEGGDKGKGKGRALIPAGVSLARAFPRAHTPPPVFSGYGGSSSDRGGHRGP